MEVATFLMCCPGRERHISKTIYDIKDINIRYHRVLQFGNKLTNLATEVEAFCWIPAGLIRYEVINTCYVLHYNN